MEEIIKVNVGHERIIISQSHPLVQETFAKFRHCMLHSGGSNL
jgi:hypothetical protein